MYGIYGSKKNKKVICSLAFDRDIYKKKKKDRNNNGRHIFLRLRLNHRKVLAAFLEELIFNLKQSSLDFLHLTPYLFWEVVVSSYTV